MIIEKIPTNYTYKMNFTSEDDLEDLKIILLCAEEKYVNHIHDDVMSNKCKSYIKIIEDALGYPQNEE